MSAERVHLACWTARGEHLGDVTIVDQRGTPSLVQFEAGEVSLSELSEYAVVFRGATARKLIWGPPVEPLPIAGHDGELYGRMPRQEGLGVVRLSILDLDGSEIWRTFLLIRPEKFRDVQEFDALVGDLCAWRTALALDPKSTTSADWRLHGPAGTTPEERLIVLRAAMRELGLFEDLTQVEREATGRLMRDDAPVRVGRGAIDPFRLGRHLNGGGNRVAVPPTHPLGSKVSSLPAETPGARKVESLDTPENRFVKFTIERLHETLSSALAQWRPAGPSGLMRWATEAERRLGAARRSKFLGGISRAHHVHTGSPGLQRRAGYRGILRTYLEMQAGLSLPWTELSQRIYAETRDVPTLYEFWCLLKLREMLRDGFGVEFELAPFTIERGGVRLKRGSASVASEEVVIEGRAWRLALSYNQTFSPTVASVNGVVEVHASGMGTWSKAMKPDFTVILWPTEAGKASAQGVRMVHFDAKYRLRNLNTLVDGDPEKTFKPDDLDKMHAYAAGIQHSVGAYVLYPGDRSRRFLLDGAQGQGVGAIGLIPGSDLAEAGRTIVAIVRSAVV